MPKAWKEILAGKLQVSPINFMPVILGLGLLQSTMPKLFKNKVYPLGGVTPKKLGFFNTLNKFAGISYFQ